MGAPVVEIHTGRYADAVDPSSRAAELARMRPDAMLINTARGGIVDEHALADALRGIGQASTPAELHKSGIRRVRRVSREMVSRLIEKAVNRTLMESTIGVPDGELRELVHRAHDEVNRIASHAQFNGMNLLTGRFARFTGENVVTASMWLHIGANMDQRERLYIGTMTAQGLGLQNPNGPPHTATFISISSPDRTCLAPSAQALTRHGWSAGRQPSAHRLGFGTGTRPSVSVSTL